jgi:hypothetical protein
MGMGSQGENSIHNLPHIPDFRLECCILKEDTKNEITGIYPRFPKMSPTTSPARSFQKIVAQR